MVGEKYWNDYFNTHNDRRFEDLVNDFYSADTTFENPKAKVRGRKELIGFLKQANQDVKIELIPQTIVMNPGVTAVEMDCVIHAEKDLPNFLLGPMHKGGTANIGMAAFYHLKEDRITRARVYWGTLKTFEPIHTGKEQIWPPNMTQS